MTATDPTPEERLADLHREADRWATAASELTNASNAAEDAAELLTHPETAQAFDTVRAPSPSAEAVAAELRSLALRLGTAAATCTARSDAARARIVSTMEAPK